jgi:hypothetical protein
VQVENTETTQIQNAATTNARVYNMSGAQRDLLEKIGEAKITCIEHIEQIKNGHQQIRQEIVKQAKMQVNNKKEQLVKELELLNKSFEERQALVKQQVESEIEDTKRFIQANEGIKFLDNPLKWYDLKLARSKKDDFEKNKEAEIFARLKEGEEKVKELIGQVENYTNNFDNIVYKTACNELNQLDRIVNIISENENLYYGAIGEQKVIEELKKLPSQYCVINDFRKKFDKPLYIKQENDRIYSIQIDHIVVGPSGLFVIETKNWSTNSINNAELFSPVKQIKRSSYALFVLLNEKVQNNYFKTFTNHWGITKISPSNIVVPINHTPNQEFQFVKVLPLHSLQQYITYRDKKFNDQQISEITDYLTGNYRW